MSKILGAAALFLLYREFSKDVSPKTVVTSDDSQLGLVDTIELTQEQKDKLREVQQLDRESVAREKQKQQEQEIKEFREDVLVDLKFQADQMVIRNNPQNYVNCKYGFQASLKGRGTKTNPYFWVCEKQKGIGF